MGFDITYHWRLPCADPERRNEALAAELLAAFPTLVRFALDHDAIAREIGVARDQVLQHWCQIELDDEEGQLGGAIITLWLSGVTVEVSSKPPLGCAAMLQRLSPLFNRLTAAGLALDPSFNVLAEYEHQRALAERVAGLTSENE
jgi:hypothetical protein